MSDSTSDNCTLATCPIEDSFYDYRPSLPANVALVTLFAISLLCYLVQGVLYKTWTFLAAMALGTLTEVIGYVGRIMSYNDVFEMNAFLIQICCLTFAPAFFSAGVYLCLSRIVIIYGTDISRIRPQMYTRIFISCDLISLILQSAGGGIASVTSQNGDDPAMGNNIMLAGLGFQVFTLALFMLLCAEYAYRVHTTERKLDPTHNKLRASKRFRGFLGALALSTLCIMIRSVYRVIEMAQGWEGELIGNETYFIVLEGVMVILATLVLNIFHPGWCLQDAYRVDYKKSDGKSQGDC